MERKLILHQGWKKFFAPLWWRLKVLSLLTGKPQARVVINFIINQNQREVMSKEKQEIYDEGYHAYCPQSACENNPYTGMDAEYWSDGYADAEDDFI